MKVELEVLLKEASEVYNRLELDLLAQVEAVHTFETAKYDRENMWLKAIMENAFEGLKNEDQRNAHFDELHPDASARLFHAELAVMNRKISVSLTEAKIEHLRYQLRIWELQSKLWSLPAEQDALLEKLITTAEEADKAEDFPF